jgi:BirA family transcriptional regulator, biotin operon repressor / biotin---[acetyl-CoA-carboxylase] ligase
VSGGLGSPRLHRRRTDSTNARARELAASGAPHGTLVTAAEQTAGRGRQGRSWTAPPGRALLASVLLRDWPRLLPLSAAVAVAEVAGGAAAVKWPNDVQLGGRKVTGILFEGRPREGWMVLGIGLNVALRPGDFPPELRDTATGLGLEPTDVEPVLATLLTALERWLEAPPTAVLAAFGARDALGGKEVTWATGGGRAAGVDEEGRLLVDSSEGRVALDAGEVHLAVRPG